MLSPHDPMDAANSLATNPPRPVESRCVIILGMHRSGTSALAGTLEQAGLFLGPVGVFAEDNLKGNREPPLINSLHDDLLEANGASWHQPKAPLQWQRIHRTARDLFIGQFSAQPIWGFKDPRTLLGLAGWMAALPEAALVGVIRHPYAVAESLRRRDGMTVEEGLSLWQFYNRALLWWAGQHPDLHLVEFALDPARTRDGFGQLAQQLGLPGSGTGFFDPSLRNENPPEPASSPERNQAMELYERLLTRVTVGHDSHSGKA